MNKIVDTYYSRGWFRSSKIRQDKELQSWVNEISIHGKKMPNGGKGKVSISYILKDNTKRASRS